MFYELHSVYASGNCSLSVCEDTHHIIVWTLDSINANTDDEL